MKLFKLPKAFTEKWLEALESNQYEQTNSLLAVETSHNSGKYEYCCLGVACIVAGMKPTDLFKHIRLGSASSAEGTEDMKVSQSYPHNLIEIGRTIPEEFPKELLEKESNLPQVLASLNDGEVCEFDLNNKINSGKRKHSFREIAMWIRGNVELY